MIRNGKLNRPRKSRFVFDRKSESKLANEEKTKLSRLSSSGRSRINSSEILNKIDLGRSVDQRRRFFTQYRDSPLPNHMYGQNQIKIGYLKHRLERKFLAFIADEEPRIKLRKFKSEHFRTEDWVIEKKAQQQKRIIYDEEMKRLERQRVEMSQIKKRMQILEDIRRQKRNLLLKYFN